MHLKFRNKIAPEDKFLDALEPLLGELSRYCRACSRSSEDAKDLMQEAIAAAWRGFGNLKDFGKFKTYLFSAAWRQAANRDRKHREVTSDVEHEVPSNGNVDGGHDVDMLYAMMSRLPAEQREALALFELSGFSIAEIAKMTDVSESGVKSRLARGREALKKLYENDIKIYAGEKSREVIK